MESPGIWIVVATMVGCGAGTREAEVSSREPAPAYVDEQTAEAPREAPTVPAKVLIGAADGSTVEVDVELARSRAERERGLMYRRYLAPNAGMLFVYDSLAHREFWMENTFLPLDIVFIDDQLAVVGIVADATPLTRDTRAVDDPSQYVLEVGAGFCRRHGVEPGSRVRLVGVPTDERPMGDRP